jgi:hypothetical protein
MNPFTAKPAARPQTPVFPQTPHTLRPKSAAVISKDKKRDNVFSKSRDTREDRGTREMKNARHTQSLPPGK